MVKPLIDLSNEDKKIDFEKATILIADDIGYNRELIKGFLKESNFEFIEACNGIEAVELTKKNSPDILLLDIKMPGKSGYEVVKELQGDELTKDIPVIVITASLMKSEEDKLDIPSESYLRKPIRKTDLVNELAKHLNHTLIENKQTIPDSSAPEDLTPPNKDILVELKEITELGVIEDLKERAQELIKEDREHTGFYSKIISLAEDYELEELKNMLQ